MPVVNSLGIIPGSNRQSLLKLQHADSRESYYQIDPNLNENDQYILEHVLSLTDSISSQSHYSGSGQTSPNSNHSHIYNFQKSRISALIDKSRISSQFQSSPLRNQTLVSDEASSISTANSAIGKNIANLGNEAPGTRPLTTEKAKRMGRVYDNQYTDLSRNNPNLVGQRTSPDSQGFQQSPNNEQGEPQMKRQSTTFVDEMAQNANKKEDLPQRNARNCSSCILQKSKSIQNIRKFVRSMCCSSDFNYDSDGSSIRTIAEYGSISMGQPRSETATTPQPMPLPNKHSTYLPPLLHSNASLIYKPLSIDWIDYASWEKMGAGITQLEPSPISKKSNVSYQKHLFSK